MEKRIYRIEGSYGEFLERNWEKYQSNSKKDLLIEMFDEDLKEKWLIKFLELEIKSYDKVDKQGWVLEFDDIEMKGIKQTEEYSIKYK